jgi:hypothetical protein
MPRLGYLFGGLLVALAFVQVSTGFCVPSFLMRVLFGQVVCAERDCDYDRSPIPMR